MPDRNAKLPLGGKEPDDDEEEEEEEEETVPPKAPVTVLSPEGASELALAQYREVNRAGFPTSKVLQTMTAFAQHCVQTGQMPKTVDTVAKAIMVFQAGRELGVPPIKALNSFYFVNNHLTMYGPVIMERLRKWATIKYGTCNATTATVTITRKDDGTELSNTVTMEDLKSRGIVGEKDTYKKHPKTMLIYKAVGEIVRHIVPEAVGGVSVEGDFDEPTTVVAAEEGFLNPERPAGRRGKSTPKDLAEGKKGPKALKEAIADEDDPNAALKSMSTQEIARKYTADELRKKLERMEVEIPDDCKTKGQLAALITRNLA